jgi:hypothetical protein
MTRFAGWRRRYLSGKVFQHRSGGNPPTPFEVRHQRSTAAALSDMKRATDEALAEGHKVRLRLSRRSTQSTQ